MKDPTNLKHMIWYKLNCKSTIVKDRPIFEFGGVNMPHVEIKCFSGRTDDQKRKCAEKIAEDISEILGCDLSSVSVAIKDIEKEDWKEKVWDKNIVPDEKILYKKPGYSYD